MSATSGTRRRRPPAGRARPRSCRGPTRASRTALHGRGRVQSTISVGVDDLAGVLGEASLEPDVDRAAQVAAGEFLRVAAVEHHRAVVAARRDLRRGSAARPLVVEQRVGLPVELGVEDEVARRRAAGPR